jgi:kumamolisin
MGAFEKNSFPVRNGAFEAGPGSGWIEGSNAHLELITTTNPHTGSYSAQLCGRDGCLDGIQQQVTIPSGGQLTYWWYLHTEEGTVTANDKLQVTLYDLNNQRIVTLKVHHNKNRRDQWIQDTLDLSAYAGRNVYLRFVGLGNDSLPTTWWVDEVRIQYLERDMNFQPAK